MIIAGNLNLLWNIVLDVNHKHNKALFVYWQQLRSHNLKMHGQEVKKQNNCWSRGIWSKYVMVIFIKFKKIVWTHSVQNS